MVPTPCIRLNKPLELGQTTILNTLNRGLALQRPPPAPRPSPQPKSSGQANIVLGRRLICGLNKKQVVKLFTTIRLTQEEDREPRDLDIINNKEVKEEDNNDFEYLPTKRYIYSQE
jgi:hypothetical protein